MSAGSSKVDSEIENYTSAHAVQKFYTIGM